MASSDAQPNAGVPHGFPIVVTHATDNSGSGGSRYSCYHQSSPRTPPRYCVSSNWLPGGDERCTIQVQTDGFLSSNRGSWSTGDNYLTIDGQRYTTGPRNLAVSAGSSFTWHSDCDGYDCIQNRNFEICWNDTIFGGPLRLPPSLPFRLLMPARLLTRCRRCVSLDILLAQRQSATEPLQRARQTVWRWAQLRTTGSTLMPGMAPAVGATAKHRRVMPGEVVSYTVAPGAFASSAATVPPPLPSRTHTLYSSLMQQVLCSTGCFRSRWNRVGVDSTHLPTHTT